MPRLIDADALFNELLKRQYSAQSMGILHTGYPNMMGIVAKQPTIEVNPVRHCGLIECARNQGGLCLITEQASLNEHGICRYAASGESEPVRHARWEKSEDNYYSLNIVKCSLCHEEWCFECFDDAEQLNYHYCPNCGAKMDLEE